jgi:dipeptidase D
MANVRDLEPSVVWNHFEDLNAVPRPSKKEEKIIAFMKSFGEGLNLPTTVDEVGNVLITKPATAGMEDRETVVIQGHIDMVHQKNNDTDFDFLTQGIQSYIDGEWVKANGTTLGADNGMGVAAAMAILSSTNIPHPAVEAIFTIDEETGMTGALNLQPGFLSGRIMLNMDTEEDHELTIGCAGGVDTSAYWNYTPEAALPNGTGMLLTVSGLNGGHSGMDIIKGLGNANKFLTRILYHTNAKFGVAIAKVDGGGLRNAIPREAKAVVSVQDVAGFEAHVAAIANDIKTEYAKLETNLSIELTKIDAPEKVMPEELQVKLINSLYALPNGVYRMSPDVPGLVETSSNLARVLIEDGKIEVLTLQRSSVESSKQDIANAMRTSFELAGGLVEHTGDYPGWEPKPEAPIIRVMADLYRELFEGEPDVNVCHAGLECGIIGKHYPQMQMISYGPTIRGAHSPDERVHIASVQKFWKYTLETLKRIPTRAEMDAQQ